MTYKHIYVNNNKQSTDEVTVTFKLNNHKKALDVIQPNKPGIRYMNVY